MVSRPSRSASFVCCSALLALGLAARPAVARNLLQADGPGGTYDLLKTAYTVEVPDCGHMVEHIAEEQDAELGRPVFVFGLHVNEDDDRCTNTDRQRAEIRAKAADIVANEGETVFYAWKFKLDAGFQGSNNFTHIMQIKSDEAAPIMTLTPRTDTLAIDGRIGEHGSTDLAKFLGVWVQVELRVHFAEAGDLAMTIRRFDDDQVLFDYSGDADTWDANASAHDSKFGLYRSLNSKAQLRDEQVRFADFCASKVSAQECQNIGGPGGGGGGGGGSAGAAAGGGAGAPNPDLGGAPSSSAGSAPAGAPALAGTGGTATAGNADPPAGEPPSNFATEPSGCACEVPGGKRDGGGGAVVLLHAAGAAWRRRTSCLATRR